MHYRRFAEKSCRIQSSVLGVTSDFTLGFLIAPKRGSNTDQGGAPSLISPVPHRP